MTQTVEDLKSWDWIFSKSPNFTVKRGVVKHFDGFGLVDIDIAVGVSKGIIDEVRVDSKSFSEVKQVEAELSECLCSQKFSQYSVKSKTSFDCGDEVARWIKWFVYTEMVGKDNTCTGINVDNKSLQQ